MKNVKSLVSGAALAIGVAAGANAQPLRTPDTLQTTQLGAQNALTAKDQAKLQLTQQISQLSNTTLNIDGTEVTIGAEYSKLRGAILKAGIARMIGKDGAVSIDFKVGKEEKEILAQAGMNIGEGSMIKFMFAHLEQYMEFKFPSGIESANLSQNLLATSLLIRGDKLVRFFEIVGYYIDAESHDFGTKTYSINTATLFQLWSDPRKVAGGKTTGLEATAHILISEKGNIDLELTGGVQRRKYDTTLASPSAVNGVVGAKLKFALFRGVEGYVGVRATGMKDRQYVIGATGSGLQVEVAQSQSIAQNDTRVSLSYRIPLNADFSSAVRNSPAQAALPSARVSPDAPYAGKSYLYSEFIQANPDWVPMPGSRPIVPSNTVRYAFDLLKETKARPNFIPTQVDAIIDPTAKPTLLVAVDWTVLPKESKVDITTGITTIALPSVPGELISALLNKSQDVRSAFSLAGNGLVFNPRLLESVLSSGTNTVEIETTNHFITLTLQKGSVVLTGVNILTKQADAPTTANDPTISNITQTSANATVNISDINGVRNLSCQLQTAAGVNVGSAVTPVNGICNFTGLTPNTSYKVVTTGEAGQNDGRGNITWVTVPQKIANFSTLGLTVSTLTFPGDIQVELGTAPLTRVPTSNSPGPLTYVSSNPQVANVNASTGQVTFVALGTATITANQAQALPHGAATASYVVTVVQAPVAPTDSPESINYPTLTITQTSVAFAGGSITDANNPGGFNASISYIVKDSGGAVVAANALTAGTNYTYQMKYNTYDGATNTLTIDKLSPAQAFTTLAAAPVDTTAPNIVGGTSLGSANIGTSNGVSVTFDESIASITLGAFSVTGMTVSFSGSGTSRTINVSTDATFTSFGTVNIPIVVTDAANNSRTITLTKTINDVAPVAGGAFAALSDTTIGDNGGGVPFSSISTGGVSDTLGRTIVYSQLGLPPGINFNTSTGLISGIYDANGTEIYTVTITAKVAGSNLPISKTFTITIQDNG